MARSDRVFPAHYSQTLAKMAGFTTREPSRSLPLVTMRRDVAVIAFLVGVTVRHRGYRSLITPSQRHDTATLAAGVRV